MNKPILLSAIAAFLLGGCVSVTVPEESSGITTDVDEIVCDSEFLTEGSDSTKFVLVSSNRSWSALLNDLDNPIDEKDPAQAVEWVYITPEAHPNIPQTVEYTPIIVTFTRNYTKTPRRAVIHIYSEGALRKTVNLTQKAVQYRLDASAVTSRASDEGDLIAIKVDCNTAWTASIDPSSTADAVLEREAGFDPSVVNLRIRENEEKVEKTVKVNFNAEDCETKTVEIVQAATTKSLKVFEAFTRLAVNGSGPTAVPVVVLDTLSIGQDVFSAGAKFFYVCGDGGFESLGVPNEESAAFPAEGISILPEALSAKDEYFIIVCGICDGYRKTYEKIHIQNWKMGGNYATGSCDGLSFNVDPVTIKTDYVQLDNAIDASIRAGVTGSASMYYHFHNAAKVSNLSVSFGGRVSDGWSFTKNQYTSKLPFAASTASHPINIGETATLSFSNGGYLWDIAYLEQLKYRP